MQCGMEKKMSAQTPFGRVSIPNKAWLAKLPPEDILEPLLPIIDTHHHLWDQLPAALPQGPDEASSTYLLDEFAQDFNSGHNIISTVYVQCHANYRVNGPEEMKPVGETEFAAQIGATSDRGHHGKTRVCQGVVGAADLTLGERLRPVLEAHIQAGQGRFRGVRASAAYDPDPIIGNTIDAPGMYMRDDFRAGIAQLSAMGLSLDAWVFHTQISELIDLAREFPDTNIIMGHCGGPLGYGPYAGKRDEVFAQLKQSLTELAACPNVSMKLGGMMIRLAAVDFLKLPAPPSSKELAQLWGPYIETCIELFGAQRCMFESNFPVEKAGVSWHTLWNTFKRITAGATTAEKTLLYSGTAQRVYKL
jgi:L-fuconolactonase